MGNCLFGKILKFCHLRAHVLGPEHGCLGPCSRSRAWMLGTMFSVQSMDAWDHVLSAEHGCLGQKKSSDEWWGYEIWVKSTVDVKKYTLTIKYFSYSTNVSVWSFLNLDLIFEHKLFFLLFLKYCTLVPKLWILGLCYLGMPRLSIQYCKVYFCEQRGVF